MKKIWITPDDARRIMEATFSFDPLYKRLAKQLGIKPPKPQPDPYKKGRENTRKLFKELGIKYA